MRGDSQRGPQRKPRRDQPSSISVVITGPQQNLAVSLFISALMAAVLGCLQFDDAAAHEKKITLNRAACNQLVEHVPDDDVSFKPGKTVDDRDVAPADLDDGRRIEFPE